jgi:alkylhydroperoxidase family enzyme
VRVDFRRVFLKTAAPDDVYEQVTAEFDEEQVVALTLAIVAINGWNRFAVGLRSPVGNYVSPHGRDQPAPAASGS